MIPCWALDSAEERPMWKPEHRRAANRNGLRYPSDLTDAEWAIVEPMIPPAQARRAQTLGERARGAERDFLRAVDRLPMEGACPRTCRRRARCTTILNSGTGTAPWSASITRCTWRCASRKDVKPARRWRSSTRRPRRARKKGVLARSFGLRRGQEDQGSQAAHPGRHAGPLVERRRSSGRCSGP